MRCQWIIPVVVWAAAGCAPHISRHDLLQEIDAGTAPPILDVRTAGEYAEAHVPGAVNVPFHSILGRRDELPLSEDQPLVVYCEHGRRARMARLGLWMAGAGEVRFLEGHMSAWKADGLPVESAAGENP